jgi:mannan endo-1,4-beta-mannosidase
MGDRRLTRETAPERASASAPGLPWVCAAPDAPYFLDETGAAFTPIGQNDSIGWSDLDGLFRRRDLAGVERHLGWLRDHGVTVLRLMLEYAQGRDRFFERPFGRYAPAIIQLWDDLFALCERAGLRLFLTPFDTYWTWKRWAQHPYNLANGGPLDHPSRLLLCPDTRAGIKARLAFAAERWGGSGALFAWDLWNEIHPAQAQGDHAAFADFITDLAGAVRETELRRFGRSHPLTVSIFGPELTDRPSPAMDEAIFRHPDLDFASVHIYGEGSIDDPKDTVRPAVVMGRRVRACLAQIRDARPFFDSEHGPIHTFKDRRKTLPEPFDDEYFRHLQWAHLASGGAGGGLRWPNRDPHRLTPGMRRAQAALARFTPLIDWAGFRRVNLNEEARVSRPAVVAFACGDRDQALAWLLRRTTIAADGRLRRDVAPVEVSLSVPGIAPGPCRIAAFDTEAGTVVAEVQAEAGEGGLAFAAPGFVTDLAFAIRRG